MTVPIHMHSNVIHSVIQVVSKKKKELQNLNFKQNEENLLCLVASIVQIKLQDLLLKAENVTVKRNDLLTIRLAA